MIYRAVNAIIIGAAMGAFLGLKIADIAAGIMLGAAITVVVNGLLAVYDSKHQS